MECPWVKACELRSVWFWRANCPKYHAKSELNQILWNLVYLIFRMHSSMPGSAMMYSLLQVLTGLLVATSSVCPTSGFMATRATTGKTSFVIWRAASESTWVSSWNSTPASSTSPWWVVVVSPSSSYFRWRHHFDCGRLGGIIPEAYNPQCKDSLTTLFTPKTRFPSFPSVLP